MQQSQVVLLRDVSDCETIPSNFLKQFANEESLQLHFPELTSFEDKILKNTPNLVDLVLRLDGCETVSESIFAACPNLITLKVIAPQLNCVPVKLFESLTQLQHLNVRFGPIENLPKTLFATNRCLTFLRLEIPTIPLPARIFDGLQDLIHLTFYFYDADEDTGKMKSVIFTEDHFKSLKYLAIVRMFRMSFHLPRSTFRHNKHLTVLELHSCRMGWDWSKYSVIDNLPYLRGLDLSKNNIYDLKTGLASNKYLENLALNNNYLKVLEKKNFRNLKKLKKLYLHNNSIQKLKHNCFDYLKQITFIDLSKNALKSLEAKVFIGLNNLNYLDLSENQLETLDGDCFGRLKSLKKLLLQQNCLNGAKLKSRQVDELNLASNKLTQIYFNNFYAVRRLNLSNNRITDYIRLQLLYLESLDCSQNMIRQLDVLVFRDLLQLRYLDFSTNQISSLPENLFKYCTNLEELYMRNNLLTFLPEKLLEQQQKLKIADFGGNSLYELAPKTFYYTECLETLRLDDNRLTLLPRDAFKMLPMLETLSLKQNSFVFLDKKLFQWNYSLRTVELDKEIVDKGNLMENLIVVVEKNAVGDGADGGDEEKVELFKQNGKDQRNRIVSEDVIDRISEIMGSKNSVFVDSDGEYDSRYANVKITTRADIHAQSESESDWINDVPAPINTIVSESSDHEWIENVPQPNNEYAEVKKPILKKNNDGLNVSAKNNRNARLGWSKGVVGGSGSDGRHPTATMIPNDSRSDGSITSRDRDYDRIAHDNNVAGVMDAYARMRRRTVGSLTDSSFASCDE